MSDPTEEPETATSPARAQENQDLDLYCDPYEPGKLFGVALVGAFSGLVAYYCFQKMDPKARKQLTSQAMSTVKGQLRNWMRADERVE